MRFKVQNYQARSETKALESFFKKVNSLKIKKNEEQKKAFFNKYGLNPSSSYLFSKNQFCVVKVGYSVKKVTMQQYLNRYMPQLDKKEIEEKPELFGNISHEEFKKRINSHTGNFRKGERLHYKIVLTPEESLPPEILNTYVKTFTKRIEMELGRKIFYQAAVHTNTAHNHIHLLIDGADEHGRRLRIPARFIKERFREISSQILTDMIGERTEENVKRVKENRKRAERFTEYDKIILGDASRTESFSFPFMIARNSLTDDLMDRIEFLKHHGFAKYDENQGCYFLKKDMEEKLKAWGRYNKFREAESFIKSEKPLELYTSQFGKIKGTVKHVYHMNDEDVNANAFVIEAEDKAYFVPTYKTVLKNLEGQEIEFECDNANSKGKITPKITLLNKNKGNSESGRDAYKTNKNKTNKIRWTEKSSLNKNEGFDIER